MTSFRDWLIVTTPAPDNLDGAPDGYRSPDFTDVSEPVWPIPSPIPLKYLPDPSVRVVSDRSVIYRRWLPLSFLVSIGGFLLGLTGIFVLGIICYFICLGITLYLVLSYFKHQNLTFPLPFSLSKLTNAPATQPEA